MSEAKHLDKEEIKQHFRSFINRLLTTNSIKSYNELEERFGFDFKVLKHRRNLGNTEIKKIFNFLSSIGYSENIDYNSFQTQKFLKSVEI